MITLLLLSWTSFQDDNVPFLPADEYSYEVEYFLKRKPVNNELIYNSQNRNEKRDMLPYVKLHFTFREFKDSDNRIEIYHGKNRRNVKRIRGPMKITLDMGYSVDMKEGVTDSTFTILFITDDKEPRARIHIEVKENGELLINETPSGMI